MNDYTNKSCPYCKAQFKPNDLVVICSDCDMPHHKECWIENSGCTTFGCLGTMVYDENKITSVTCTQLEFDEITTNQMRYSSSIYYQDENGMFDLQENIAKMIGINESYYISKFNSFNQYKNYISFNGSAFLIAPFWSIYRKMYGYSIFLICLNILTLIVSLEFFFLFKILESIVASLFSNYIYFRHLEKHAKQLYIMNEYTKNQYILKKGGVNLFITFLSIIGYIMILLVVF